MHLRALFNEVFFKYSFRQTNLLEKKWTWNSRYLYWEENHAKYHSMYLSRPRFAYMQLCHAYLSDGMKNIPFSLNSNCPLYNPFILVDASTKYLLGSMVKHAPFCLHFRRSIQKNPHCVKSSLWLFFFFEIGSYCWRHNSLTDDSNFL